MRAALILLINIVREGGRPPRRAAHYSIDKYCAGGGKAAKEGHSLFH
jgi:hypothetical protein